MKEKETDLQRGKLFSKDNFTLKYLCTLLAPVSDKLQPRLCCPNFNLWLLQAVVHRNSQVENDEKRFFSLFWNSGYLKAEMN